MRAGPGPGSARAGKQETGGGASQTVALACRARFSLSFPNLMSSAGRVKKVPFYEKHRKNSWKETLLLIYSIKMHHLYGDTCKYRLYVTQACLLSDVHPQTNCTGASHIPADLYKNITQQN